MQKICIAGNKKPSATFENLTNEIIKIQGLPSHFNQKCLTFVCFTKNLSVPLSIRHTGYHYNVRNIKRILIAIFIITGIVFSGKAQEMHGYVHSNYAGITGGFINPSSLITSKLYLDINIVGLQLNVDNNYIYLAGKDYRIKHFLSQDPELPTHIDDVMLDNREYYDRYNTDLKNGFSQIRIMGPSAMFATGKQAFGLSTSYRVLASGNDLPYDLAKFALEGLRYHPQQNVNYINNIDFRAASLALAEIAGSYSRILYRRNREFVAAGVTIKGLFSSGGAFGFGDNIDYIVPNSDDMLIGNINGKFGTSLPIDYDNNDFRSNQLFLGKGIGFDIGFTYQKMISGYSSKAYSAYCEIPYQPYLYRIGVSLLDLGSVKFNKNPIWLEMVDASNTWANIGNSDIENVNELFQKVSYDFSGDPNKLIRRSDFSISLPTAVSVQFDYRINNTIYVNSTWIHPLVTSEATVIRPAQIALTPRMETGNFGLAVPMILYNYKYPRIGLSARFYKVVIGTDKLGGFFGLSDFTGMDFYVMVKLPFFRGSCGKNNKQFGCQNLEYKQKY